MIITRGRLVNDGGEGHIYEIEEHSNLLTKEYKETDSDGQIVITPELRKKLEYMRMNPPEILVTKKIVAWPQELLVNEQDRLIGFVMPKLEMNEHLQRVYSYKHPVIDGAEYDTFPSLKSRISIAINLSSGLHELHRKGYVVGDFNHHNIGVNYETGQIYFMDCDSFHITDENKNVYRTSVIMPGYLAPEIIKHCSDERAAGRLYNLDEVALPTFTIESDLFCLAVHIFKLLMNGVDPFRGVKYDATGSNAAPFVGNDAIERNAYVFRDGNKPSAAFCPPATSLPPIILSLFHKAFIEGRSEPLLRPEAGHWYHALSHYLAYNLKQCSNNVKHQYYKALNDCPYCVADKRHLAAQGYSGNEVEATYTVSPNPVETPKATQPIKKQLTEVGIRQEIEAEKEKLISIEELYKNRTAEIIQKLAILRKPPITMDKLREYNETFKVETDAVNEQYNREKVEIETRISKLNIELGDLSLSPSQITERKRKQLLEEERKRRQGLEAEVTEPKPVIRKTPILSVKKLMKKKPPKYIGIKGNPYGTVLSALDLNAKNLDDSDIQPLEYMINLDKLILSNNQIINISPLKKLTNLTKLNLSNNSITDISTLKELTNILNLNLDNNQIADISPLTKLKKLKSLSLDGNPITKAQINMLNTSLPDCVISF
jgi:serine/threonine protein kinase